MWRVARSYADPSPIKGEVACKLKPDSHPVDNRSRIAITGLMQFLYFYTTLCIGCYASSQGAPALVIIPIAMLLTLPNIAKQRDQHVLTIATAAHSVNGLIFATIAHVIGRGIAFVLGT